MRARTRCTPAEARTSARNGDLPTLLMRLPSSLKTTRLIRWPRTVTRNPSLQVVRGARRSLAVPLLARLCALVSGLLPEPGEVPPGDVPPGEVPPGDVPPGVVSSGVVSSGVVTTGARGDRAAAGSVEHVVDQADLAVACEHPPDHRGPVVEGDAREGHQVALEGRGGAERCRAAHLPVDVARGGPVDEQDGAGRGGRERRADLEHELRVGVALGVEGELPRELGARGIAVGPRVERPVAEVRARQVVGGRHRLPCRDGVRGGEVVLRVGGHGVVGVRGPVDHGGEAEAHQRGAGDTPSSPLSTDGPVFVAVAPARTTKGLAVARLTGAAWAAAGSARAPRPTASAVPLRLARLKRVRLDMKPFPYGRAAPANVPRPPLIADASVLRAVVVAVLR